MNMKVISEAQARLELSNWYERRRFSAAKIKAVKGKDGGDEISTEQIIIEAIMEGALVIKEDASLELDLVFPTNDGAGVSKLIFKARMTVGEKQNATKGLKQDDGEGRLIAYIATLTNQPQGVIKALEAGVDFERAGAIAVYFL